MTAIAGFVHYDGSVWMGGDSAGVAGLSLTVRRDPKVFKRDGFLFGFTGSYRVAQLVRFNLQLPEHRPGVEPFDYLATSFVDSLRNCLKTGGTAREVEKEEIGGRFLLGYAGRLFQLDFDYQVGEALSGFDAVGCGADVCRGALAVTRNWTDADARVRAALSAAEEHSGGVRGPFIVLSQR